MAPEAPKAPRRGSTTGNNNTEPPSKANANEPEKHQQPNEQPEMAAAQKRLLMQASHCKPRHDSWRFLAVLSLLLRVLAVLPLVLAVLSVLLQTHELNVLLGVLLRVLAVLPLVLRLLKLKTLEVAVLETSPQHYPTDPSNDEPWQASDSKDPAPESCRSRSQPKELDRDVPNLPLQA